MSAEGPRAGGSRLCPHCGAAMAPDQDWCLECGTAATTRVMAPPSWKVPAAVIGAVVVAFAIAVVIAVSVLSGDAERSVSPVDPAAQVSSPSANPQPAADTQPEDDVATAATGETGPSGAEDSEGTTGETGATGATSAAGAEEQSDIAVWNEGKEAYTVVLITSDRDGAEQVAKQIAKSSGARTGVLDTTKYEFFSPNLWVAWAGELEEKTDAQKLADEIRRKDGRSGYVTLVKKK